MHPSLLALDETGRAGAINVSFQGEVASWPGSLAGKETFYVVWDPSLDGRESSPSYFYSSLTSHCQWTFFGVKKVHVCAIFKCLSDSE